MKFLQNKNSKKLKENGGQETESKTTFAVFDLDAAGGLREERRQERRRGSPGVFDKNVAGGLSEEKMDAAGRRRPIFLAVFLGFCSVIERD